MPLRPSFTSTKSGDTESRVRNNDGSSSLVTGPSIGGYAAYVKGPFSVDAMYKVDFFDVERTAAGGAAVAPVLGLTNSTFALNLNQKVQLANAWWIEPTVGFSYTRTSWDGAAAAAGFQDGTELRLQGGARAGTTWNWSNVTVEPTHVPRGAY